jgi:hypothetical protein
MSEKKAESFSILTQAGFLSSNQTKKEVVEKRFEIIEKWKQENELAGHWLQSWFFSLCTNGSQTCAGSRSMLLARILDPYIYSNKGKRSTV